MKFFNIVFIGLAASAGAKSIVSRSAGYGDEVVTPAPVPAPSYGAPAPVAPVAPAPVETVVAETKQEYNAVAEPAKVEQSGYRKKRGAAYGDEAVTPAPAPAPAPEAPASGYGAPAPPPVEQTVTETKQEYNAVVEPAKVEQSGYRKKRGAAYGDEAVTPAPAPAPAPEAPASGYGAPAPPPVEQTVTETKQEYNAVAEPAKVEQSGYRKKRGAAYGDEAVTPAPASGYGAPAPAAPAPAPVEQTVTETKQEYNAAPAPSVPETQPSGY